jgi:hypothetical protein
MGAFGDFAKGLVTPLTSLVDQLVTDTDEAAKLKHALSVKLVEHAGHELDAQKSVIVAEASGSGLKANWRPITMLTFVSIIANNHIVAPYAGALFGPEYAVQLPLPDVMWELIKLGMGGYIIGRSAEQVAKQWGTAR